MRVASGSTVRIAFSDQKRHSCRVYGIYCPRVLMAPCKRMRLATRMQAVNR